MSESINTSGKFYLAHFGKYSMSIYTAFIDTGQNRTLIGLKDGRERQAQRGTEGQNRTLIGLKDIICVLVSSERVRQNRTLIGLKEGTPR